MSLEQYPGPGTPSGAAEPSSPRVFILHEIVATVCLRRRLILSLLLLPIIAGLLAALLTPARFSAEGLLIVLGSRESAGAQDIAGIGPSVLSVDQPKIVQSEIAILESDDVIADALRRIGPAVLYPSVARPRLFGLLPPTPEPLQLQRATELFARDLHADVESDSNVLRVIFSRPDRIQAIQALQVLFDAYLARRQAIFDRGNAAFLTEEVRRTYTALDQVGAEIQALKSKLGVLDVAQALQMTGARADALARRADTLREQEVASFTQLAAARAQLAEQTRRVFASQETTNRSPNDDAQNTLLHLQVDRDHLAQQYTSNYAPLQELDRKIDTARRAIAGGSAISTTREVRNPAVDLLTAKVVSLQVDAGSLDKQLAEIERQETDLAARSTDLLAAESRLAQLTRRQASLDTIYRQFATRAAGARLDEAAQVSSTASVHVVQQPTAPLRGRSLGLSFIAIGTVAGLLVAVAGALMLTWMRRTFASQGEAERSLALPTMATFAAGERFDLQAGSPAVAGLAAMLLDLHQISLVQFLPATPADMAVTARLVRAAAVELARDYGQKTFLVDLAGDGRDHLALLGTQPITPMADTADVVAINTVYPRLWVAFNASASALADVHAAPDATRQLIGQLREEFDRVLVIGSGDLDSYSLRRFTVLADANVIVVRGEHTPAQAARQQRDTVLGAGGTLLGFVYGEARTVIPPRLARLL